MSTDRPVSPQATAKSLESTSGNQRSLKQRSVPRPVEPTSTASAAEVRHRRKPSLLPRRRPSLLGTVISGSFHLVILTMFFWAVRLAIHAHELQPVFDKTPTLGMMTTILGSWSQFWVVSVALATFTLVTWPFHGWFIKLLGILPLLYGISRQVG